MSRKSASPKRSDADQKEKERKVSESLLELREKLRTKYRADVIRTYTEPEKTPTISTGIIALDEALGGGIAQGRMTELLGENSSGKTTIILSTIIQAQKQFPDKVAVYIDAEHALDTFWAAKNGVDISRLEHVQPNFAEEAIDILEEYAKSDDVSLIALDSVPALISEKEMDGSILDSNIGLQARMVATAMRRIVNIILNRPVALMFINQKRAQLQTGNSKMGSYEPTKGTGGKAMPFYMTTRLEVARIGTLKDGDEECGQLVQVYVRKNKIGAGPGKRITFEISIRHGIDHAQEVLDYAGDKVKVAGTWYTLPDGTKVQGKEAAKKIIREKYLEDWTEEIRKGLFDAKEKEEGVSA